MHKLTRIISLSTGAVVVAVLAGCAEPPHRPPVTTSTPYAPAYPPAPAPVAYVEFGRVSAVDVIRTDSDRRPSGAGAIIGGIAGAVIGNQIGAGAGRALATGAGAVGGAVLGNHIEGNQRQVTETYRVSVRIDNGTVRAYDVPTPGDLRVGDRVRIQDGQISRI